ncbi:hypothetical protein FHG87_005651 [Trinorchestia longiramus]|nr:hypothetical protein FHG87_005651 [Trinorchestia longiramus]
MPASLAATTTLFTVNYDSTVTETQAETSEPREQCSQEVSLYVSFRRSQMNVLQKILQQPSIWLTLTTAAASVSAMQAQHSSSTASKVYTMMKLSKPATGQMSLTVAQDLNHLSSNADTTIPAPILQHLKTIPAPILQHLKTIPAPTPQHLKTIPAPILQHQQLNVYQAKHLRTNTPRGFIDHSHVSS